MDDLSQELTLSPRIGDLPHAIVLDYRQVGAADRLVMLAAPDVSVHPHPYWAWVLRAWRWITTRHLR